MRRVTRRLRLLAGAALLASSLLLPALGSAAVVFDATAHGECGKNYAACGGGNTTLTYALTVGAGATRQVAVAATVACLTGDTAPTITSITYAGVNLTSGVTVNPAAARRSEMWAMPAGTQPTSGTNDVIVTLSTSIVTACPVGPGGTIISGAVSVTGADQTTRFTSTGSGSGTGTAMSMTVASSGANDLGVQHACHGTSVDTTTETERWNVDNPGNSCASTGGATAAGGDTSFSWTSATSDSWNMVGVVFLADAGAAGPPARTLTGVGAALQVEHGHDLTWQDNAGNETDQRIERRVPGGPWVALRTVGPNVQTYRDAPLGPGAAWCYQLRACNLVGCSAYSNEACGVVQ